ncbi:hypothetical protein [Serratia nevei]|uniref:hypothetical protein n=1 Tax=Serratia nevei TaxID=2703794 RepID=UPI003FA7E893
MKNNNLNKKLKKVTILQQTSDKGQGTRDKGQNRINKFMAEGKEWVRKRMKMGWEENETGEDYKVVGEKLIEKGAT